MTTIAKRRLTFSLGVALCACFVSWLIVGEASPLSDYFLDHVEVPNLWSALHVVPYLIMVIARPPFFEEGVLYLSVFLQWFAIAYLTAKLIWRNPT